MGNGKAEYVQVTVRLPQRFFRLVKERSERWGTSLQDTFLIILYRYFMEVDED